MKTDILALIVFFMMGFNLCIPVIQKQFTEEINATTVKADPLGDDTPSISEIIVLPGNQTVSAGDNLTIDIYCIPNQPVKAFEFMLSFDPFILQANSVVEGNFFSGYETFFSNGIINNVAGTIANVYGLVVGQGNVSEPGMLVSISFSAVSGGTSSIDFISADICNETMYLPVNLFGGNVTVESVAYHYWYAPENSFGIQEMKTVNWSYFKSLFLAHTDWMLEYKRYEYSDWTDGSDYLTIERTWNESGFWKFNLIFDVPVDIYSARFTFGVDLPVLQYVERSGYEVWINYTANATEQYSVMFNWSDIASIPNLVITKDTQDGMFWFRFRRDNIPAGHYEFDPIFGGEAGDQMDYIARYGSSYVVGSGYQCPSSGIADNMSAKIQVTIESVNMSCALYDVTSGNSLVAYTEEKLIPVMGGGFVTFNLSDPKPYLVEGHWYNLTIWSEEKSGNEFIHYSSGSGEESHREFRYSTPYDYPNFPSPFVGSTRVAYNNVIYASYTENTTHDYLGNESLYPYYKQITIESDYVDGDLTNFPILVSNTSSDFVSHMRVDAYDAIFTDSTNTTVYNHEIEKYDSTTGELIAWVNITSLSGDTDTVIYLHYGNDTTGTNEHVTDTWDGDYYFVGHMDDINSSIEDSTANNIWGTYYGNGAYNTTGYIGAGHDFDGQAGDYGYIPSTGDKVELTAMVWFTQRGNDLHNFEYVLAEGSTAEGNGWGLTHSDTDFQCDGKQYYNTSGTETCYGVEVFNNGTWGFLAMSFNYSNYIYCWENDSYMTQSQDVCDGPLDGNVNYAIAARGNGNAYVGNFTIDEVRFALVSKSPSYINTTYNTTRYQDSFITVGTEQTAPSANNAPTQSGESPVNTSTDISVTPSLYVICTDTDDGDTMNATWRSNSSDAWVDFATNSSITTGTNITQDNSNFSAYSTTYWWSVNLTDGTDWCNETYHFTTKSSLTITNPYPANESVDIELNPILNITINDADGDMMNITWYSNSSDSWQIFGTGGVYTQANYSYGFESESDLDNWTTTGTRLNSATYAHSGTYSLEVEGATEYACHELALANYSRVNISWWNYPRSIEDSEYLYLRFYNGTSWTTIRTVEGWQTGIEGIYTHYYDELDTNSYVFNDDCKICWNVSASGISDMYYLDDINIRYGYLGNMTNGTYTISNSNFTNYSTTYYWNVSVNDGTDTNDSDIFHFTTLADTTPPTITINFAGNLSDSGGPYWRPPGETTQLSGVSSDGYYTNDSKQSEDWIYINITANDTDGVNNVWLQWLNETIWTNWTYVFSNPHGDWWEFNVSDIDNIGAGYNYSFDIVANDTEGNSNVTWWNKTGIDGSYTRRYVQLNCTTANISHSPLYMYNAVYDVIEGTNKEDRLHHDQGYNGSNTDTGFIESVEPIDTVDNIYCDGWTGLYYEDSMCVESFTLNNIYFHFWWSGDNDHLAYAGWRKSREEPTVDIPTDYYTPYASESHSNISYDGGTPNDIYYLDVRLFLITPESFTDNDIYEFMVVFMDGNDYPSIISNRSFTSFVLFNVPDNATLNASHADTDGDSLSDWTELYVNYTNPFLADTDNDGINDYWENQAGSDPNNYTETFNVSKEWVTLDTWNITLSNLTIYPFTIDTWNLTLSNLTISPFTIDTWNITLSNTTQSYILDTWNITLSNLTISPYILDTWNITLSNIPQPYILDTWNLTLSNLTISAFTLDTWNITLSNTSSHDILEPSFETVTNWIYYENESGCFGEQSSSGVTDGSKSYGLAVQSNVETGYCRVYQTYINLTDINNIYADLFLNSDVAIDVPAYVSLRVNDDILYERKIGQTETILIRNVSIDVSGYGDYCTLEYRINQTDVGIYDEGIFAYIDNLRTSIWQTLDTWNLTLGNLTISPYILDTWEITLSNTPQPDILDTWNLTLSNTSVGEILDRWNITLSNSSFFFITDVKATPSEAVIDDVTINITCNVTSLYAIVNVTVNMTEGHYDMANIGDLYYYIAINSTIGTHYYHIYANDTSGDQIESSTYSFKIIGLSCSFTYTVSGGLMTLTPTITGATHYQWTFINETGVKGSTSWIPIEDIGSYIQGYVYPTIITVILSAKNINFNQYANYSDVIRIYKSSFDKPEPTIDEPEPEPSNIFKDTADAVGKWFGERNGGELLFMAVIAVIAALFVVRKKYPSKKFIYQILKKKKKKEKERTPHEILIERIDRLEENVFSKK